LLNVPALADRDRKVEDIVANLFTRFRSDAGLATLTRITTRTDLEQLTCTAASRDIGARIPLIYETSDPSIMSSELKRRAAFKQPSNSVPRLTRFAVAVWAARQAENGVQQYWVGVSLYPAAFWEFIDYTMTDDIGRRNNWKRRVSPDCQKAK
jgi:hypothetical protein